MAQQRCAWDRGAIHMALHTGHRPTSLARSTHAQHHHVSEVAISGDVPPPSACKKVCAGITVYVACASHLLPTQRAPPVAKQQECLVSASSSTCSQSDADADEQELFSPAFHALPEDHAHLHVHDAPAALARRRAAHEGDENAEPPCVSTSSTCTSLGNPQEDVEQCALDGDTDDDAVIFDPFAFIKNLPPLPDCVNGNRRTLLPRYERVSCVSLPDDFIFTQSNTKFQEENARLGLG